MKDNKRNELIAEMVKVNEQINNMKCMDWEIVLEGDLIILCDELKKLLNEY